MMEKLLLTVLEISIAYSPIILLFLLLSPILGKRYGFRLRYFVWLALAVRMAIPLNAPIEQAFTVNLFASPEVQAVQEGWFLPNPAEIIEREASPQAATEQAARDDIRTKTIRVTPVLLAAIVWAAGVALFLLYHLGSYFYTAHRLRRWSTAVSDAEILRRFESVKKELGIRRKVWLWQSSKAASPLLMGFLRTRMILPEKALAAEQLDFMLRHELWHLKRGDLWYKLLMLLANAVHWFNPLVWLMDRQARLDTELACDADVLAGADGDARKAYGYTVLSFLEQGWRCKTPLTSRFYGGKTQMKERFSNIMDTSGKKKGTALLCAFALIIALVGCAVNAEAESPAAPTDEGVMWTVVGSTNDGDVEQWFYGSTGQSETAAPPTTGNIASSADANESLTWTIVSRPEQTFSETANAPVAEDTASSEAETEPLPYATSQEDVEAIYESTQWSKDAYSGGKMAWPLPNNTSVIQSYGETPQIPDNIHTGVDIAAAFGSTIIAANDGTVVRVSRDVNPGIGFGMYLMIDHGGEISTLYAQCSEILVEEGERVVKGEKIAEVGSTGNATQPHLHFEVREANSWRDPMPYITSNGFIWPTTEGYISTGVNGFPGHTGMDIAGLPIGTHVYAAAAGTVTKAEESNVGYGKHIMIDHGNGFMSLYAHNSELYVNVGDIVSQGQTIAAIGRSGNATGYVLHFEIRYNGRILNPENFVVNPLETRTSPH